MGKRAHGKRYRSEMEKVPAGPVPLKEAIGILKEFNHTKFDQTVELVMWLGIDPKQADQQIRGAMSLPHGIGKSRRVVAFCEDDQVDAAKAAGAIEAGGQDVVDKIQKGWTDFDVAVAVPAIMKSVSRLGRILGPQGKMPSPKSGTVVEAVPTAVREYAAGKVEFRNDVGGNIHIAVGKLSFEVDKLAENVESFVGRIKAMKPASSKGTYIRKVTLTATMAPGVTVSDQ